MDPGVANNNTIDYQSSKSQIDLSIFFDYKRRIRLSAVEIDIKPGTYIINEIIGYQQKIRTKMKRKCTLKYT
jgi:hypothetical protein